MSEDYPSWIPEKEALRLISEEREATEREIAEWLRAPRDDGGDWFRIYRDLSDAIERGEYRK